MNLWYAIWFGKKVDEAYLLDEKEIRSAAKLIIVIVMVTTILAMVAVFLSQ